jgi:hypothetical protein
VLSAYSPSKEEFNIQENQETQSESLIREGVDPDGALETIKEKVDVIQQKVIHLTEEVADIRLARDNL